jgi:hypothetical protein
MIPKQTRPAGTDGGSRELIERLGGLGETNTEDQAVVQRGVDGERERLKAARHAEVAWRYSRHSQRRRFGPPESVIRAQLRRLLRHRSGDDLPGGLDSEIVSTIGHHDLSSLSPEERGQFFQVTHEERLRFDMRNFAPFDASPTDVRALVALIKAHNDYLRKRKCRKQQRERKVALSKCNDLDRREEDLFAALDHTWRSISDLMRDVGQHGAWRRPDGARPTADGLRQAMHRAANDLVRRGMIEQKIEQGAKAQNVRLVRRVFSAATRRSDDDDHDEEEKPQARP